MVSKGIDVSSFNLIESYQDVAEDNIDFAVLKIIRKDMQPDKLFEKHWAGFQSTCTPIQGVYNYSYATTGTKFKSDAKRVVEVLAGRRVMVWLDIEDKTLAGLGKTLIDGIREYGEVIQKAGLQFGVYTYLSFYNSNLKKYADSLNYPFWLARYPSDAGITNDISPDKTKLPAIGKVLYGWQYSSKGIVKGIRGYVDLNEWYMDIEAKNVVSEEPKSNDINDGFRSELAKSLGLPVGADKGEVLNKTVTVSAAKNQNHLSVTPLERLLKEYGYYTGIIEADHGKIQFFGNGMTKATALFQAKIVKLKRPDQEWTKGNKSYKKALFIP